jgi:hypothetical protein
MSEVRRAACRNARYGTDQSAAPHGPHEFFPHSQAEAIQCRGWDAEEAGAVAMLDALDEALKPFAYDRLPDSTRLAVHPLMLHALTRVMVPSYAEFAAGNDPVKLPVPVTVDAGLPYGAWRLILAEGVIGDGWQRGRPAGGAA